MSYEGRVRRLDQIVSELESQTLDLADALRLFEEGVELLRTASDELASAEGRVQLLIERSEGVFEVRDTDV